MFLHLSVILFTGGVSASVHAGIHTPPRSRHPPSRHPPEADIPGSRHLPGSRHYLGVEPHPEADTPPGSRHPPGRRHSPGSSPPPSRHTPSRQSPLPLAQCMLEIWATKRTVRHSTGMHTCGQFNFIYTQHQRSRQCALESYQNLLYGKWKC